MRPGVRKPASVAPPTAPGTCADSDGDSVCDTADLCPDTPKGVTVDAKGCPVEKAAAKPDPNQKFEDVHFAFDRSDLTDYAKALLDNAAKVVENLSKHYCHILNSVVVVTLQVSFAAGAAAF